MRRKIPFEIKRAFLKKHWDIAKQIFETHPFSCQIWAECTGSRTLADQAKEEMYAESSYWRDILFNLGKTYWKILDEEKEGGHGGLTG
jgi:hypothetical protein